MKLIPTPDFSDPGEIALTNQNTLRKTVGLLGMALPLLLYLFLLADAGYNRPMPSISHYYMTRSCGIFVIVVSLLAIFLMIYKGKEKVDFYLSTTAGACALLLLLFPTTNLANPQGCEHCVVTTLKTSSFRPTFHLIAAAAFLFALAIISFFLFTRTKKSKEDRGKQKRRRNRVYRTCGVLIVAALLVMLCGVAFNLFQPFYDNNNLTFWMETLAVEAFGFSWFVKGETILKDKPYTDTEAQGTTRILNTPAPRQQL
jgi:multisubunit Na+/H+ antiporter MnhB subunit